MRLVPFLLFFASGIAGLVYEVSWARQLGGLFGHAIDAEAVTLTACFAGMALGSWGAAPLATRSVRPLRGYAVAELLVAGWALAVPLLLELLTTPTAAAFLSPEGATARASMRAVVAFVLLLPGAVALGATLPFIAAHFRASRRLITSAYAVNIVGAFVGVLATTFVLLLHVGVVRSSFVAAAISVGCGLTALNLGRPPGAPTVAEPGRVPGIAWRWQVLAALSGFGTLALQVLYTRLFALTFHNSAYTFGAVLAVFLAALSLGSARVALKLRRVDPARSLGWTFALAAVLIPASIVLFAVTTRFGYFTGGASMVGYTMGALGLVALIAGPVVATLGGVLPLCWAAASDEPGDRPRVVGRLTGINTAAAAVGGAAAAFVLLPTVGLWSGFAAVSLLYLGASLALARGWAPRARRVLGGVTAVVLLSAALVRPSPPRAQGETVARWETPYGWIDVTLEESGALRMRQNLHYQYASSADLDRVRRQAHIPLLAHEAPERVAFLGLATGITAGAALDHPEVDEITIVELIPEVVEAAGYFAEFNGGVHVDPRVTIVNNDARSYLYSTGSTFDVIVADLFVPWESHTGYLYTVEHYAAVRSRLAPGGLFCQWIALWQAGPVEIELIADSLRAVFPHVDVWVGGIDEDRVALALIASERSLDLPSPGTDARLALLDADAAAPDRQIESAARMAPLRYGEWPLHPSRPLNTDERPRLEFLAPLTHRNRTTLTGDRLVSYERSVLSPLRR